jgi:hypothetical protein
VNAYAFVVGLLLDTGGGDRRRVEDDAVILDGDVADVSEDLFEPAKIGLPA